MPEVQTIGADGMLLGGGDFTTLRADVLWVYRNYRRCVKKTDNRTVIDLDKANSPPPSEGAVSLFEWAADHRHDFFSKLVPQYLGKEDEAAESDEDKVERKSLVELRRLIETVRRDFEREGKK